MGDLKAPFPWFGGKSRAADVVAVAFGTVDTYCEPFAGSLGVLLQRDPVGHEVVNDNDGWLVNFWRAVRAAPEDVAAWCDQPVTELDLTARHLWLLERGPKLKALMEADPEAFDAKAAGWWVWGICSWLGGGWCSGDGPWVKAPDGLSVIRRGEAGQGVNRKLPHMVGRGVNRQLPHMGDERRGVIGWFDALAARLRRVRVVCGDFERVLSDSVLHLTASRSGAAGVLLDPPYPAGFDQSGCYAGSSEHAEHVFARAVAWALANQWRPNMRIALCGYEGMWEAPPGWTRRTWKNVQGYRVGRGQRQEVIWCSPYCLGQWASEEDL
jgi:DNA adenine methylase